jgi:homoserine kinase
LPETLSRTDAVFNLGRMALLLAGLARPAALVRQAMDDRIHQPARTALFPEAPELLQGLVDAGALAACWSGAGPTLLGVVTTETLDAVRDRAESVLTSSGVPGQVLALRPDLGGIVYGDDAEVRL